MDDLKCRGYAGNVPVYCAHDKIVPIGEIKPNPKNPNQHPEEQIELLAKIIKTQGWRAPVTVSTLSGLVVRGHGRLMAAQHLGLDSVPVDFQHYSCYDAELADLLADNKIAELAEIDNKMLAEVFQDIDPNAIDMDITGYTEEEYNEIVSALMDATAPEPGELGEDEAVEVQEETVSQLGDMWLLGKHRLMCGDCTEPENTKLLMQDKKAHLVFTDPPYGVDYEGINNDSRNGLENLLKAAFENYRNNSINGASVYCFHSDKCADIYHKVFRSYCHFSSMIIWEKQSLVLSQGDYQSIHEPCLYGWFDNGTHRFFGDRRQTSVWQFDRKTVEGHTTPKPIGFICKALENSSKRNERVIDLFGGSGSTLIACEQLHRICYMMELDPRYVDVIVRRYIGVTGKTDVTLLRNGKEIPVEKTGILD